MTSPGLENTAMSFRVFFSVLGRLIHWSSGNIAGVTILRRIEIPGVVV